MLLVSVARINENQYPNGVPQIVQGELIWQGAYVFSMNLTSTTKIPLRGTIMHIENGNLLAS